MDIYFKNNSGTSFRFPVTPRSLTVRVHSRDSLAGLADGSQINTLNPPALREISFEALLPNKLYHFAVYDDGIFRPAAYFLELIDNFKNARESFIFVADNSIRVSLEDYTVTQDADFGGDVMVSFRLREARTATLKIMTDNSAPVPIEEENISQTPAPPKSYTVKKGDSLWSIAKTLLGSGTRYTEIYDLNRTAIGNPNLIYAGQVLIMP